MYETFCSMKHEVDRAFGLDVVELLIGLSKAVLSVEPEFLYVSYRKFSSDFSRLYLLV